MPISIVRNIFERKLLVFRNSMAPIAFHIHVLTSVYDITVVSTAPQEDVTKRQWTYEPENKWLKEKKKKLIRLKHYFILLDFWRTNIINETKKALMTQLIS